MIAPEIIEQFIDETNTQISTLQNLDRTYTDLLTKTSEIKEESRNSQFEEAIIPLNKWFYTVSTQIRRRIEALEIHREYLIGWYNNGLLGSEDW